jgi:hypothetical protein
MTATLVRPYKHNPNSRYDEIGRETLTRLIANLNGNQPKKEKKS